MSVLGNLNYIKNASLYSCARPNMILVVEAAFESIGPVLINAVTFGCRDIVKMRAGISPWHSRAIRALVEGAIPPSQKKFAKKLLMFTIPLEKALFFYFVVDLTVDFFARWQSQIFRLGACGAPLNQSTASGPLATFVMPAPNGWTRISYAFTTNGRPFTSSTDFIVPPGWYFSVFFSLTVKPLFNNMPCGSASIRLRELGHGSFAITSDPATPDWFFNPIHAALHMPIMPPKNYLRQYIFEGSVDNIAIGTGGSCTVSISEQPVQQQTIIPTNCLGDGTEMSIHP
jgi:hypothetical protein